MSTQRALEAAFADLVFGAPPPEDASGLTAWLMARGVSEDDARALLEQGVERFLVYRSLVHGTLREALEVTIPRTIARLGSCFDDYFTRFLAERGPRTHYLRDTTTEFLEFCAPLWAEDERIPPYLVELARHEALHIQIAAAPTQPPRAEPAPLDLENGLAFVEACRLVRYEHAVHRLSEALDDRSVPERQPSALFVYRSSDHTVRYLALSPAAATLIERLMAGHSLRDSLTHAAETHATPLDALLSGAARVLADLSERGAVLGPCRPQPAGSETRSSL